jgi:hypothetical protein
MNIIFILRNNNNIYSILLFIPIFTKFVLVFDKAKIFYFDIHRK